MITVDAAWSSATSDAIGQFEYNPESGELFIHTDAKGGLKAVTAFVEIVASDFITAEQAAKSKNKESLIAVRHGNWVSVIDPIADKLYAANLGPTMASRVGSAYTKLLRRADGAFVLTFIGRGTRKGEASTETLVYVYNSKNNTLGWFPVRGDGEPHTMSVGFMTDDVLVFRGEYIAPIIEEREKDGKKVKVRVGVPKKGELLVDLKTGSITKQPGADFASKTEITKVQTKAFNGMYEAESAHEFIGTEGTPQQLAASANPADPTARKAAIAKAKAEIEFQRGVEKDIGEAMKPILGQDETVDALKRYAQAQIEGNGHGTILFGGPTGVGKTSGFSFFINGWRKALGLTGESSIFYMSLADIGDAQLLESRLKGSTPPYVGSDKPSPLVRWMLSNDKGGGLFFDEIEKTKPEVLERLMTFLEKGEMELTPHLVAKLCETYKDKPEAEWPKALWEQTAGGTITDATVTLKLSKNHIIGLGTNAGNETYGDSGVGKALTSEQDITQANKRFNSEIIKQELKARGYKPEVINRFQAIFAFKKILKKDHVKIVDARMRDVQAKFAAKMIDLKFTDGAKKFFDDETYDPSAGARNIERQLNEWLTQNMNDVAITKGTVSPGDEVVVDVKQGNGATVASVMAFKKNGEATPLAQYTVGKPLPPSPEEMLKRARANLQKTLEKNII
ncbi:MAG: ATP-dependent Clp protease ATP-binding subunit, partial [Deltaproteobacteria bacterium]|nr:ATP-dependent Clp protease ATP-binding subunit [Deltaproteobacteria bacterium]